MAITLKALLIAANFPEKEVEELLLQEEYMTPEEKFELAESAWHVLAQRYFSLLELEKKIIYEEIGKGKRKFNPNDIEEAKAKLLHELTQKLEAAESEESIEEVRRQLEKFASKPLLQEKKNSNKNSHT